MIKKDRHLKILDLLAGWQFFLAEEPEDLFDEDLMNKITSLYQEASKADPDLDQIIIEIIKLIKD